MWRQVVFVFVPLDLGAERHRDEQSNQGSRSSSLALVWSVELCLFRSLDRTVPMSAVRSFLRERRCQSILLDVLDCVQYAVQYNCIQCSAARHCTVCEDSHFIYRTCSHRRSPKIRTTRMLACVDVNRDPTSVDRPWRNISEPAIEDRLQLNKIETCVVNSPSLAYEYRPYYRGVFSCAELIFRCPG